MKRDIIFIFIVCFHLNTNLLAQIRMEKINIEGFMTDKHGILQFIRSDFTPIEPDREKLRSIHHSLSLNKFNMVLNRQERNFFYFNIAIRDMYAYMGANGHFCLYLLVDLDRKMLMTFIDHAGLPQNILPKSIENNDFDFLVWNKGEIDIVLYKDRIGGDPDFDFTQSIFQISNIKGTLLSDDRKLFNGEDSP